MATGTAIPAAASAPCHSLYARSIDSFLGCLVTQLEATGINSIVQLLLIFLIPVRPSLSAPHSHTYSCVTASAPAHIVTCPLEHAFMITHALR